MLVDWVNEQIRGSTGKIGRNAIVNIRQGSLAAPAPCIANKSRYSCEPDFDAQRARKDPQDC